MYIHGETMRDIQIDLNFDDIKSLTKLYCLSKLSTESQSIIIDKINECTSIDLLGRLIMNAVINEVVINAVASAVNDSTKVDDDADIAYKDDMLKDKESNSDVNFVTAFDPSM